MLMKFSVLIVDDEPLSCARMKRLLQSEQDISSIAIAENGQTALPAIRELNPDIIFLDIEMPGLNGFEMLKKIPPGKKPYTIFVTAYEEHAVKAFEVEAVDYLLKPVTKERLSAALDRARNLLRQSASPKRNEYPKHLAIKEQDGVHLIKMSQVDWVEADGRYVILHSGSRSFAMREGINSLSARLDPSRFLRIHRSFVVNVDRIAKLQPSFHGDYRVLLHDGTRLLLTRHYKSVIQKILGTSGL